jgi:RNA polymerase sigma factor (sigma-70 family)
MSNNNVLFELLYAEFYPMVHHVCVGFMKGNRELAEDLAQETFINTWRSLDKFKGASSYKTWVYRITMNTCLKYIRDNKIKDQVPLDQNSKVLSQDSSHQDHGDAHQELYQAIGQLNEIDRLIIMMVLDELEYKEIADVVGISESNLRVKIHRIKKSLKEKLKNE